ncbi:hypothetical protein AB0I66_22010 [Streptomyces sp. NPDC050439]|uniref:hypothetical protein n=1 Tax=unclassified Streptomyces TaxID=2593676 RepID=UPI0034177E48
MPLCAFLVRHVDWLVAHPAVAEATADVAVLARRARLIAHEERLRTVRVGPCATQGCQGQLTVDVDAPVILATGIRCDQNAEHVWGRQEWAELSRRLTQVREQRVGRIPDFEQNARDSFRKRTRGTV